MSSRRKDLTLKEKVNVIEYAKVNKCTQLELAKKFQISQAQVSKLLKKKREKKSWTTGNVRKIFIKRRKRCEKESQIEDALLQWFSEKLALNNPVCGFLLKQKAKALARQFKINDFKAINVWLFRRKVRNQIYL